MPVQLLNTSLISRSETVRTATDSKLVTVQKELSACKAQSDKFLGQRDKLASELKMAREKVIIALSIALQI